MTLDEIFKNVHELVTTKGFAKDPVRQLLYLNEEVGEVCREVLILTTDGDRALGDPEEILATKKRLVSEAYDVIWNTCSVLRSFGVTAQDLEAAARETMAKNKAREFLRN